MFRKEFQEKVIKGVMARAFEDWIQSRCIARLHYNDKNYLVKLDPQKTLEKNKLFVEIFPDNGEDGLNWLKVQIGIQLGRMDGEKVDKVLSRAVEFYTLLEAGALTSTIAEALHNGFAEEYGIRAELKNPPNEDYILETLPF